MAIRFQENGTSPIGKSLCYEAFRESEEIVKGWGFSKINYIPAGYECVNAYSWLLNGSLKTLNLFTGSTKSYGAKVRHNIHELFDTKMTGDACLAYFPDKDADITFEYKNVPYAHFYHPNIMVFLSRVESSEKFKHILKEFLKAADKDMKNRKEKEPMWLLNRLALQRKAVLAREIDSAGQKYYELQREMLKQREISIKKSEELNNLCLSPRKKDADSVLVTWSALKNNKKIRSIVIDENNGVIIKTHEYRTRPIEGIRYKLGRFEISLKFGQYPEIRNLSHPNMPHPHMNGAGSFCWGNVHDNVIRAIAEGDILKLANLTLTVIGEVNVSDQWSFKIQNFPRCRASKKDKEAASKTPTATVVEIDDEDYDYDWTDDTEQ